MACPQIADCVVMMREGCEDRRDIENDLHRSGLVGQKHRMHVIGLEYCQSIVTVFFFLHKK